MIRVRIDLCHFKIRLLGVNVLHTETGRGKSEEDEAEVVVEEEPTTPTRLTKIQIIEYYKRKR